MYSKNSSNLYSIIKKSAVKQVIYVYIECSAVKNLAAMQETWVQSLGQEDPLQEDMATCSSILA